MEEKAKKLALSVAKSYGDEVLRKVEEMIHIYEYGSIDEGEINYDLAATILQLSSVIIAASSLFVQNQHYQRQHDLNVEQIKKEIIVELKENSLDFSNMEEVCKRVVSQGKSINNRSN